jgi:exodeoxyribonuclease V gamma subunit
MPGFHVFTSNRTETLVARLAETLREPLAHPLAPEVIVVQSRGMERWVAMELARLNGICANTRFPFPNAFMDEIFGRLRPEEDDRAAFAPDALAFRVMHLLPGVLDHPDFAPLRDYLAQDPGQLKRYQLCRRLAGLYDQYAVFRPEMLLAWDRRQVERDADHRWQARLWGRLTADRPRHRARFWVECLDDLARRSERPQGFPERVALFGVSYLPPGYLRAFERLSRLVQVNLFFLNPCREYWGGILPERAIGRVAERHRGADRALLHLERGNRLLSSCGGMGREFLELLCGVEATGWAEEFVDAPGESLLERVQTDILNLRDPEADPAAAPGAADDGSIAVHSCHGPMREIEVLHDQLLQMLEEIPGLRPADIVVMAPDIAACAPYISAVFGAPVDSGRHIPFCIADRGLGGQLLLESAWSAALELKGSRLGATQVLRLLEFEPVRRRFAIEEADLPLISDWVRQSGIRWGVDENARGSLGLPAERQNTWAHGLDRLLLGYAMPAQEGELFGGILALDAVEGTAAQALAGFLEFVEHAFRAAQALEGTRSLNEWARVFHRLTEDLWRVDESLEGDLQRFTAAIDRLADLQADSGFEGPVPLEVAREFLREHIDAGRAGRGFLAGGVTFCALLPMRTIPFQVVCLIGMDYDAFPRESPPVSFDLIARDPRPGDRSRRNDDRYLFLEALLAARRRFYVSYTGRDIEDNSPRPPSVLVSELMDAVHKGYGVDPAALVTQHPLQAFASDYFTRGVRRFSYARENLAACVALNGPRRPRPFFGGPLPERPEDADPARPIELERLTAFLSNPAKHLARNRLGIQLPEGAELPDESEPFALDPLNAYRIGQLLLEGCLAGVDPMGQHAALRAEGELPHGAAGDLLFRRLCAQVRQLAATTRRLLPPGAALEAFEFACAIGGRQLVGRLARTTPLGCLQLRYAKAKAADYLQAWLGHLVMHVARPEVRDHESLLIGRDRQVRFGPVADAPGVLAQLLQTYRRGLLLPVHFFPECSLAYCRNIRTPHPDEHAALEAARQEWVDWKRERGEGLDPYNRLCHGEELPLGAEFRKTAVEVFGPLLDHCEPVSTD